MLISREELKYPFQGAQFNLNAKGDLDLLTLILSQLLYREVSQIRSGYWLYRAPALSVATVLAKQAVERVSHIRKLLRIFTLLGERPLPVPRVVKFLLFGIIKNSWGEYAALEITLREGLILNSFYALLDTISHSEIQKILKSIVLEKERHLDFGERETERCLKKYPFCRDLILSEGLVQVWILHFFKKYFNKRIFKKVSLTHSVMTHFDSFYDHCLRCFELRVNRLVCSSVCFQDLSMIRKMSLYSLMPLRKIRARWELNGLPLIVKYLHDPVLNEELNHFHFSIAKSE